MTSGPPAHAKAWRLSPAKLAVARCEFDVMENLGIIRRSSSSWASPLHLIPKKEPGSWRYDYRQLNNAIIPDLYLEPHLQDFATNLQGCHYFSKVNLICGYHQVPVRSEDIHKTVVITPFGLWELLQMLFDLKNAAQSFQRFMDRVCASLESFPFIYLDNILCGK